MLIKGILLVTDQAVYHHEGDEEHEVLEPRKPNPSCPEPLLSAVEGCLRGEICFFSSPLSRCLLAKDFAEFFLVLVIICAELGRNGKELQIFRLHLGVDAGTGRRAADRQDELLTFFRQDEIDKQFRRVGVLSFGGNRDRMQ